MEDKERKELMPKLLPMLCCFVGGLSVVATIAFALNNSTGFYFVCALIALVFCGVIAVKTIVKMIKRVNVIG